MAFGSGAFTQVEAERGISVEIADDSSSSVALVANSGVGGVDNDGGGNSEELQIDEDSINVNSDVEFGDFGDLTEEGDEAFSIELDESFQGQAEENLNIELSEVEHADAIRLKAEAVEDEDFDNDSETIVNSDGGSEDQDFSVERADPEPLLFALKIEETSSDSSDTVSADITVTATRDTNDE